MERYKCEKGFRWYVDEDGKEYVSVTTVLDIVCPPDLIEYKTMSCYNELIDKQNGKAYKKDYKEKYAKIAEDAADVGTQIHEAVEADLKGIKFHLLPDCKEGFSKWLTLKERHKITATHTEMPLRSKLGFSGTADIIGSYEGSLAIMDVKTGRYDIKTGWQLAAYKRMYEEMTGDRGLGMVGLHCHRKDVEWSRPLGKFMPTKARAFKYQHFDACLKAFLFSYEVWKMDNYNYLKKRGFFGLDIDSVKGFYEESDEI